MTTQTDDYLQELLLALRLKRVPGPRIAEALAEVDSHVAESGEDPREAFGPAKEYAERLARSLAPNSGGRRRTQLAADVANAVACFCVGSFLADGLISLGAGEPGRLGLPALGSAALGLALLAVTVGVLIRATRRTPDRVLDPRTGVNMAGRMPWWVPLVAAATPVGLLVLGVALGRTGGG